ncbi:MAG: glycosyltransferase family 39 protein [bacterium]
MVYVLALATLLRLIFLNQSLWLDEAIQAEALMGHLGPILRYALADFQPPLYHFLLLGWTRFAGFSEVALRTPSLLAGLGTVYFVIKIGELIGSKKIGVIAGLLTATNPLLIYYSQEGRTYALTCFLVTASMYYFIKLINSKDWNLKSRVLYLLFTILFLWTSYLSWFLALAQGVYLIVKKRWDIFFPLCLAASTLLFWLPSLLSSIHLGLGDASMIPNWSQVVGSASVKALALTWVKLNLGRISFDNKLIYTAIVSSLALIHLYIIKKYRQLVLQIWLLAPIILASLVSLYIPVYNYTRVLFVVPAYLLLLAIGLSQFKSNILTYLLVSICLASNVYFWLTPRFHREDWRALTRDLNSRSSIVIAVPTLRVTTPLSYYHLSQELVELPTATLTGAPIAYIRYGEAIFDPELKGQAKLLSSGYTITTQKVYSGIQLDIYENRN